MGAIGEDGWNNNIRDDGVRVLPSRDSQDHFQALRADGLILSRCVCCLKLFDTPRGARINADYCWPLVES